MLGNIGGSEFVIILLVLLVIFGSQRMTNLAKGLGETTKELKKLEKEYKNALKDEDPIHVEKEPIDTQKKPS